MLALAGRNSMGGYGLSCGQALLYLSSETRFRTDSPGRRLWDQQVASLGWAMCWVLRGDVLGRILTSSLFKSRLDRAFGDIAYRGAERAAPIVTMPCGSSESRTRSIWCARTDAATAFLRGQHGQPS